jgi:hypothetical protein
MRNARAIVVFLIASLLDQDVVICRVLDPEAFDEGPRRASQRIELTVTPDTASVKRYTGDSLTSLPAPEKQDDAAGDVPPLENGL